MAFQTATGYGNLPNGNFSPVIYSKQVQLAFRKSTVVGDITNSDYFGEISGQGDTVKIIKEPEISVSEYARGTNVTAQDLEDADFNLVIDKANYFAFKMDDIEDQFANVDFVSLAADRAARADLTGGTLRPRVRFELHGACHSALSCWWYTSTLPRSGPPTAHPASPPP